MKEQIFLCKNCKNYTLEKICQLCGSKTENPTPAKFSILDKFGKYRRLAKKEN